MPDSPSLSIVSLPQELVVDDLLGLRDQLRARFAAVIKPKGKKHAQGDVTLPDGVEPMDALPPHIEKPWKRFEVAANDLQSFRNAKASALANEAHAASGAAERDEANADADDRWRAFEQWNGGAAGLADDGKAPSPTEARWLHAQLFPAPDGLRFISRRPRAQWTAMEQRMDVLRSERAQSVLKAFGGERHWHQMEAAHLRFGKAFGFTKTVAPPDGGPTDGRPQWAAARDALRTLVQKVESYADPEIEGTEALASYLLGPFIEMLNDLTAKNRRQTRAKKDGTTSEPPDGTSKTP